eukprot:scaffold83967_cov72-Phaeocystis_antarctica.AAC.3
MHAVHAGSIGTTCASAIFAALRQLSAFVLGTALQPASCGPRLGFQGLTERAAAELQPLPAQAHTTDGLHGYDGDQGPSHLLLSEPPLQIAPIGDQYRQCTTPHSNESTSSHHPSHHCLDTDCCAIVVSGRAVQLTPCSSLNSDGGRNARPQLMPSGTNVQTPSHTDLHCNCRAPLLHESPLRNCAAHDGCNAGCCAPTVGKRRACRLGPRSRLYGSGSDDATHECSPCKQNTPATLDAPCCMLPAEHRNSDHIAGSNCLADENCHAGSLKRHTSVPATHRGLQVNGCASPSGHHCALPHASASNGCGDGNGRYDQAAECKTRCHSSACCLNGNGSTPTALQQPSRQKPTHRGLQVNGCALPSAIQYALPNASSSCADGNGRYHQAMQRDTGCAPSAGSLDGSGSTPTALQQASGEKPSCHSLEYACEKHLPPSIGQAMTEQACEHAFPHGLQCH